jgi:redox-sensitive bicupin YhaK (pirin superfamily)
VAAIRPGEVNWMTAGRGIVHSERTPPEVRRQPSTLAGLQVWVALPKNHEETPPVFAHHGAGDLPQIEDDGHRLKVVVGEAFGARSPVEVFSAMFYVDATLAPNRRLPLPRRYAERAAYIVSGEVRVGTDTQRFGPGRMLVLRAGEDMTLTATESAARVMLLGGEPMDGPRHVWWNFVSSSKERIEQAKADWAARRFAAVPDEAEFIPLPERKPPPVSYP